MKKALLASILLSGVVFGATFEDGMAAYKAKDYKKAATVFEELCAKNKDATSCYNIGYLYENGTGVTKNLTKAFNFFQQACDAGNGGGCNGVAYAYENGLGAQKNEKKGLEYYEKGCGLNDAYSCYHAGAQYKNGKVVPKNDVKAHSMFEKSCGLNNANACYYYGLNLVNGIPGTNERKANVGFYYLDRACILGSEAGCTTSREAMKNEIESYK